MAEGEGLEPTSPKAPVFKTGALPITLTLREAAKRTWPLFYALRGGQSIELENLVRTNRRAASSAKIARSAPPVPSA